jgi:hypothetical protein
MSLAQCFIQAFARRGKAPPGEAMGPPRGKLSKKFFMQVLPDKAPRGDALGPPGGPTLGAPVFELPGGLGGGLNPPSCLLNPPKQDALGYPGGSVSTPPPPLLMMLNCLCVMTMTMTMNRQMLVIGVSHINEYD